MDFRRDSIAIDTIDEVATTCASLFQGGDVVVLVGELGAGKTTLVSSIAHTLGITDLVTSPTFAIVAEYDLKISRNGIEKLIHADMYRLTHVNELYDLGFETIFDSNALTMIEWGERIEQYIDKNYFLLTIDEKSPNVRSYRLQLVGESDMDHVKDMAKVLERDGWISHV